MAEETNLTLLLKKLEEIAAWFDEQQDIDVEAGLKKVKQAATLIKASKKRLKEIENEFREIEKEIADDSDEISGARVTIENVTSTDEISAIDSTQILF